MTIQRLGKMIKTLREQKGLTQIDLARKAKVAQSYVALLETGERKNPSIEKLQRIAKALGVGVEKLLR